MLPHPLYHISFESIDIEASFNVRYSALKVGLHYTTLLLMKTIVYKSHPEDGSSLECTHLARTIARRQEAKARFGPVTYLNLA